MKKVTSLVLIFSVSITTVFITGCSSISTNDGANVVEMKDLVMPTYKPIIKHKTQRVSGSAELNFWGIGPIGITWGNNSFADNTTFGGFQLSSKIKTAAVYQACENNRCDMLLATKYKIKVSNYPLFLYKTVSCTVTGFPGVITDVEEVKVKKQPQITGLCLPVKYGSYKTSNK